MNALEIIEQVRAHNADVVLENDTLVVRGRGKRLPEELSTALREHKAEVMIALGAPHDVVMADILREIRPFLTATLQALPDSKLLVLVNYAIMHGFGEYLADVQERAQAAARARRSNDRE